MPFDTTSCPRFRLGVSLKMYFGYQHTLSWCRQIADIAVRHDAIHHRMAELFVMPSYPTLPVAHDIFASTHVAIGAQDLSIHEHGAFTGEVGAPMLAELGCAYVEIGHAERRRHFGETEDSIAVKTANAIRSGLTPVLCIGESEAGDVESASRACIEQFESAVSKSPTPLSESAMILAYEPHWAIGSSQPAPHHHIAGVCHRLRQHVVDLSGVSVIYGGSAGPGLLTSIHAHSDGLFLGRFVHEPSALTTILDEVLAIHERLPRTR
ncbi:triose-phosphate isomerase family protein [Aidingimonas halophila]|uniref:Triosephosphate isomerase n=1 Tax=Aidingimonas halophila TaxID=574349 RepID=A0A1H3FUS5_9GAMM|nr:triose-phosphate isomerase family protein [Aidingimonas halophila]SDX93904.1 triosephosphate isomerase [Aidingimonas halophila]